MFASSLPGPVSSALGLPSLPPIKLLAAGLALCVHAHVDCSHISRGDFDALTARMGMPEGADTPETGSRALRDARGMCDVLMVHGVYQSKHNIAGIPTAVYLYPHCSTSPCHHVQWGTSFVCRR
jgi:hypothetical protein